MSSTDPSFWEQQLTTAKATLVAFQQARTQLMSGNVQSYTLDTGQTVQKVTKFDLPGIQRSIGSLLNEVATLEARCGRAGAHTSRPDF